MAAAADLGGRRHRPENFLVESAHTWREPASRALARQASRQIKAAYRAHLAHFLWHGTVYQRFAVRNYGNRATDLQLSILFENDFADLFEVRGSHRDRRGSATAKLRGDDQVL